MIQFLTDIDIKMQLFLNILKSLLENVLMKLDKWCVGLLNIYIKIFCMFMHLCYKLNIYSQEL